MIRGTRRQMIVMHVGGSRYFDTAYLLLRERADSAGATDDILREADRLLAECDGKGREEVRARRRSFLWGCLCGSLVAAVALAVPLLIAALSHGWFF